VRVTETLRAKRAVSKRSAAVADLKATASVHVNDTSAIVVTRVANSSRQAANKHRNRLAKGIVIRISGNPRVTTVKAERLHAGRISRKVVGGASSEGRDTAKGGAGKANTSTARSLLVEVVVDDINVVVRERGIADLTSGELVVSTALRGGVGVRVVEESLATVGRITITVSPAVLASKLAAALALELPSGVALKIRLVGLVGVHRSRGLSAIVGHDDVTLVLELNLGGRRIVASSALLDSGLVDVEPRTLVLGGESPLDRDEVGGVDENLGDTRSNISVRAVVGRLGTLERESVIATIGADLPLVLNVTRSVLSDVPALEPEVADEVVLTIEVSEVVQIVASRPGVRDIKEIEDRSPVVRERGRPVDSIIDSLGGRSTTNGEQTVLTDPVSSLSVVRTITLCDGREPVLVGRLGEIGARPSLRVVGSKLATVLILKVGVEALARIANNELPSSRGVVLVRLNRLSGASVNKAAGVNDVVSFLLVVVEALGVSSEALRLGAGEVVGTRKVLAVDAVGTARVDRLVSTLLQEGVLLEDLTARARKVSLATVGRVKIEVVPAGSTDVLAETVSNVADAGSAVDVS